MGQSSVRRLFKGGRGKVTKGKVWRGMGGIREGVGGVGGIREGVGLFFLII